MSRLSNAALMLGFVIILVACTSNVKTEDKNHALIAAARNGKLEEVKSLLNKGADVNFLLTTDKNSHTALMAASMQGRTAIPQWWGFF